MIMRYRGWVVAFALMVVPVFCAQADAVYQYQGDPFTVADPPYAPGDSVSGEFSVALPIKPLLPMTDISSVLTDFSFTDGQQTRTPANTLVCGFEVATDAAGNIVDWLVSLREAPTPVVGDPLQVMDVTTAMDQVGSGPSPGVDCFTVIFAVVASNVSGGNWTATLPTPMPTDYGYTGAPFDFAQSPYVVGENITGSFTLTGKLPAFLPSMDLTSALLDFSFTDGQQTRTLADSTICAFSAGTDATGNLVEWRMSLREAPPSIPGDPQQVLDVTADFDLAGIGPANTTACGDILLTITAALTDAGGSWDSSAILPVQPMVYEYTGQRFTVVELPYTTNDRITGSITVNRPIPADITVPDLSASLLSLNFTDGVQTRNLDDTTICAFEVETDSTGDIVDWLLILREAPTPASGDPQLAIDSIPGRDAAGVGAANTSACGDLVLTPSGSNFLTGNWRGISPPLEVPALSQASLLILVLAMLLLVCRQLQAAAKPSDE